MGKATDWLRGKRSTFIMLAGVLEGIVIVLLQWIGAGAVGYFIAQAQVRNFIIEERADHLAEIERLQNAYADTLGYVSAKVGATAEAAQMAADQSAQAAVEAKDTARAAKRATVPAAAPTTITEAQRAEINRKIEAANRKVREKP